MVFKWKNKIKGTGINVKKFLVLTIKFNEK